MIFAGCAGSPPTIDPSEPELPPPPVFEKARVRSPQIGDPLVLIAARERAGRHYNAAVIDALHNWYCSLPARIDPKFCKGNVK